MSKKTKLLDCLKNGCRQHINKSSHFCNLYKKFSTNQKTKSETFSNTVWFIHYKKYNSRSPPTISLLILLSLRIIQSLLLSLISLSLQIIARFIWNIPYRQLFMCLLNINQPKMPKIISKELSSNFSSILFVMPPEKNMISPNKKSLLFTTFSQRNSIKLILFYIPTLLLLGLNSLPTSISFLLSLKSINTGIFILNFSAIFWSLWRKMSLNKISTKWNHIKLFTMQL